MLISDQYVVVNWHPRNKKHLESKGYKYTHTGLPVRVKVEDMLHGSKCRVRVLCDYCGREYTKVYKDYFAQRQNGKDCCGACRIQESKETNQKIYGGNSPACSPDVVKKIQQTCLNKYGALIPVQNPVIAQKIIETNIERYGTPHPSKNPEIREKILKTNQMRYGGNSSQCDPEIRKKTLQTRLKNGTMYTSIPECEMVEKLKILYGDENCFPQYLVDRIIFDCLIVVKGIKIDVEFDGKHWHQDQHKDIRRDYFSFTQGYKVLRFRGDNKSPSLEQIQKGVDYLVSSTHKHLIIDI